jgi:hypothetical protein
MTRKGAKKGKPVTLPDSWFADLKRYKLERGLNYETMGADLAAFFGEVVPVSTLHGYMHRRVGVTEELTLALAALTGLPPPPMAQASTDPEIAELVDVGRQLKAAAPELFRQQLEVLRSLVIALKGKRGG